MKWLGLIELMLSINFVLFAFVFAFLARPPVLVQFLAQHVHRRMAELTEDQVERMVNIALRALGMAGTMVIFTWGVATAFVISLYERGFFWRL